jgi:hypothetical protein
MDGVQSFGEKRAFRRTIGWLCRSGVRSSNDKSLLLLGLFAREFTRRIPGLGQAGGGRGTGFKPSPSGTSYEQIQGIHPPRVLRPRLGNTNDAARQGIRGYRTRVAEDLCEARPSYAASWILAKPNFGEPVKKSPLGPPRTGVSDRDLVSIFGQLRC